MSDVTNEFKKLVMVNMSEIKNAEAQIQKLNDHVREMQNDVDEASGDVKRMRGQIEGFVLLMQSEREKMEVNISNNQDVNAGNTTTTGSSSKWWASKGLLAAVVIIVGLVVSAITGHLGLFLENISALKG